MNAGNELLLMIRKSWQRVMNFYKALYGTKLLNDKDLQTIFTNLQRVK